MKGQQEILSVVLLAAILFGVVSSVWMWATPLVEHNREAYQLRRTEDFSRRLADAVKFVARTNGKTELSLRGMDPRSLVLLGTDSIDIFITTHFSVYELNTPITFSELGCGTGEATWGLNQSEVICVTSTPLGPETVRTSFSLRYVPVFLRDRGYSISFLPLVSSSTLAKNVLTLESRGTREDVMDGRRILRTIVAVNVI